MEIPSKSTVAVRRRRARRKESLKFYIECFAALATVAIAGFTAFYVHYSSKQWETMQQQNDTARKELANNEAAQRADLNIEDFKVVDFQTASNSIPYATFKIKNTGYTVADEISVATSARTESIVSPKELRKALEVNAKLAPDPSGWSLAPGGSRSDFDMPFDLGPELRQLLERKRSTFVFVVEVSVSYRDIFKQAHVTSDCLMYDPMYHDFNPCVQGYHRD